MAAGLLVKLVDRRLHLDRDARLCLIVGFVPFLGLDDPPVLQNDANQ